MERRATWEASGVGSNEKEVKKKKRKVKKWARRGEVKQKKKGGNLD